VYGGGGNPGATYKNDFIELFNRGNASVDISGWSVQYSPSGGNSWSVTPLCPSGPCTIAAGQYLLIQEGAGGSAGNDLPAPDVIGTIGRERK
jgi:hypothetical protein